MQLPTTHAAQLQVLHDELGATITQGHSSQKCRIKFNNGYSASLIADGYGSEQGLYEIAVMSPDGDIDYTTPITDDVLGYLTPEQALQTLNDIGNLPIQ